MTKSLSVEEKFELIKRNTEEIIGESELKKLLKEKKQPVVYLGTAVTGRPHIGYFVWALKLADFLRAGFKVKILLADLHGALDNTPWPVLDKRYDYYKKVIPLMFESLGVDTKDLEFVKGSDFQLKPEYMYDLLQASTFTSVHDALRAASEVVKNAEIERARVSSLIYPLMQVIDEQYLGADIQYAGVDQRKIMVLAREVLPKLGYSARIEVMTPMIQGLQGSKSKMSASVESSKIDLLDDYETIKKKLQNAECVEGNTNNGIMAFLKHVIMVIKHDKKEKFTVERDKKYGGDLHYSGYGDIEKDFVHKKLHPQDLKMAVAKEINNLLKPVQKERVKLEKSSKEAYK